MSDGYDCKWLSSGSKCNQNYKIVDDSTLLFVQNIEK